MAEDAKEALKMPPAKLSKADKELSDWALIAERYLR
jgi:hypothetical protein